MTAVSLFLALAFLSAIIKIMFSKMKLSSKEESAYHLLSQGIQLDRNKTEARKVFIGALKMKLLARTEDKNSFGYEFQKREFFSTINDFRVTDMAYQYQVISKNKYIN